MISAKFLGSCALPARLLTCRKANLVTKSRDCPGCSGRYVKAGRIAFVSAVLMSIALEAQAVDIDVPAGDSRAFLAAISEANASPDLSIIRLNGGSDYLLNLSRDAPEPVSTGIIIQGNNAHIVGAGEESYGPLFRISNQGALELSDLTIRGFRGTASASVQDGSLIRNAGVLHARHISIEHIGIQSEGVALSGVFTNYGRAELAQVRVADITVDSTDRHFVTIALYNRGAARLENVLIVDGNGGDPESVGPRGAYIQNVGFSSLDLRFSSLILQSEPAGGAPPFLAILDSLAGFSGKPETSVSGSMFVGTDCSYSDLAVSGGHNLFTSPSCDLNGSSDLLGVSPGKLQFLAGRDGGIEILLPPNSPALDGITNSTFACPGSDAVGNFRPQDGNHDGVARCDIGAFENKAGEPLQSGGINGLYHDPHATHRYLYVLETNYTTLVVWNTFDRDGNQLWVYGVGDLFNNGRSVVADAYINTSGGFLPNGEADDDVDHWGVIRLDLSSCTEGRVTYQSDLPEYGSGEFSVVRLAYSKQIGCVDSE